MILRTATAEVGELGLDLLQSGGLTIVIILATYMWWPVCSNVPCHWSRYTIRLVDA